MVAQLVILALTGCGRDACDRPWYRDRDRDGFGADDSVLSACAAPDGYVAAARDCDDRSPGIHPGVEDACNGVDDDCDGEVDSDALPLYGDSDGDGWGNTAVTVRGCDAGVGFVPRGGDCDDADPLAHPQPAEERCNLKDDDCDGLIDEDVAGATPWFPDYDGDGYGTGRGRELCRPPVGWVTLGGDCDDFAADRNPGAVERCDSRDNDCDRATDELDPDLVGAYLLWRDLDHDGFGAADTSAEAIVSCTLAVGWSETADDCDDDDWKVNPTQAELCNAVDDDCDGAIDDADPGLNPDSAVATFRDVDGDGLGDPARPEFACAPGGDLVTNDLDCDDLDVRVGSDVWLRDADGDGAGAGSPMTTGCVAPPGFANAARIDCDDQDPAVAPGRPDACGDGVDADCSGLDPACADWATATHPRDVARASYTLADRPWAADAGDLDGDGYAELAVLDAAGLTVVFGPPPERSFDAFGPQRSVAFGVTEGPVVVARVSTDPQQAVLIGDPADARVWQVSGWRNHLDLVQIVTGLPGDGTGGLIAEVDVGGHSLVAVGSTDAIHEFDLQNGTPLTLGDAYRSWTTGCGPLNALVGGGPSTIGAGVPECAGRGSAWVVSVVDAPSGPLTDAASAIVSIDEPGARLGTALAFGDLDGDGTDDLAVSAPGSDRGQPDAGAVFVVPVVRGPLDAGEQARLEVRGAASQELGATVAMTDADGDGIDDLWIGDPSHRSAWLFFGPRSGLADPTDADVVLVGEAGLGRSLTVTELDGVGSGDLLLSDDASVWWMPGI